MASGACNISHAPGGRGRGGRGGRGGEERGGGGGGGGAAVGGAQESGSGRGETFALVHLYINNTCLYLGFVARSIL